MGKKIEIDNNNFKQIVENSYSFFEVRKQTNLGLNRITKLIDQLNLTIDHFDSGLSKRRFKRYKKVCPVCKNEFEIACSYTEKKVTCSRSCANKHFKSRELHPRWKGHESKNSHRRTCFENFDYKCVVCGEDKLVEVHHIDENRNNNNLSNLIPLCPTHHRYMHSKYKHLIEKKVLKHQV